MQALQFAGHPAVQEAAIPLNDPVIVQQNSAHAIVWRPNGLPIDQTIIQSIVDATPDVGVEGAHRIHGRQIGIPNNPTNKKDRHQSAAQFRL